MPTKEPFLDAIRDQFARILHDWDHGTQENDSPTEPCWFAYRIEADLLMPTLRAAMSHAWEHGARHGSRGLLPAPDRNQRNPFKPLDECERCHGAHGWYGHFGAWEPCQNCGVAR